MQQTDRPTFWDLFDSLDMWKEMLKLERERDLINSSMCMKKKNTHKEAKIPHLQIFCNPKLKLDLHLLAS